MPKPKTLEVGRAYRLYAPFSRQPGDVIAVVSHIDPPKWNRQIRYAVLHDDRGDQLGWYRPFLTSVHSEEPRALQ